MGNSEVDVAIKELTRGFKKFERSARYLTKSFLLAGLIMRLPTVCGPRRWWLRYRIAQTRAELSGRWLDDLGF